MLFLVSCCAGNIPDSDGVCLHTLDGDAVEGHQQSLLYSLPSVYVEIQSMFPNKKGSAEFSGLCEDPLPAVFADEVVSCWCTWTQQSRDVPTRQESHQ